MARRQLPRSWACQSGRSERCAGPPLLLATVLLTLTGLPARAQPATCTDSDYEQARNALREYSDRVNRALLPALAGTTYEDVQHQAGLLAREVLGAHRQVLRCEGERYYAELPAHAPFDLARYDERFPGLEAELAAALGLLEAMPSALLEQVGDGFLAVAWNPVVVATFAHTFVVGRAVQTEELAQRSLLMSLAPPTLYRVEGEGPPTVAMVAGAELCLVELRYAEGLGIFVPTRVRVLVERAP